MKDSENRPGRELGSGWAPRRWSRSFGDSSLREGGGRDEVTPASCSSLQPGWAATSRLESGEQARGRSPGWGSRAPESPEADIVQPLSSRRAFEGSSYKQASGAAKHRARPAQGRPRFSARSQANPQARGECGAAGRRPEEVPRCSVPAGSSGMYPLLPTPPAGPRLSLASAASHQLTRHELNRKARASSSGREQSAAKPESQEAELGPGRAGGVGGWQESGDWGDSSAGEEAFRSAMQQPRGERPIPHSGAGTARRAEAAAHCKNKPSAGSRRRAAQPGHFLERQPLGALLPSSAASQERVPALRSLLSPGGDLRGLDPPAPPVLGRGSGGASGRWVCTHKGQPGGQQQSWPSGEVRVQPRSRGHMQWGCT